MSNSKRTNSGRRLLEQALDRFRRPRDAASTRTDWLSPQAFRAVIDERLRSLERQLDEVKGRVNGLLFLLAGSVAAQLILKITG